MQGNGNGNGGYGGYGGYGYGNGDGSYGDGYGLVAHTGIEWAQASASYNEARIARLRAFINGGTSP